MPLARGRGQLARILETLARLTPWGDTDFLALREWAESGPEPGLAVVISDFLAPQGIEEGLAALLAARHEVLALQVLAPQELASALRGLLRLVDLETGRSRVVTVGKSALLVYREALAAHNRALADFCAARGITYRLIPSSADPIEAVLALLSRRRGWCSALPWGLLSWPLPWWWCCFTSSGARRERPRCRRCSCGSACPGGR